jgi:type VI secretion system secreted protein Hcp
MPQKNYLKIDQINGESQIRGHENEIEVLSWNWAVTVPGGASTSGGSSGRAKVSGITFVHYVDLASPKLLKSCLAGTHSPRAVLSIHSDPNAAFDYLRLTLDDVIFTSLIISATEGCSRTIETVTMEFAKITEDYTRATATGTAGAKLSTTFDVRTYQVS